MGTTPRICLYKKPSPTCKRHCARARAELSDAGPGAPPGAVRCASVGCPGLSPRLCGELPRLCWPDARGSPCVRGAARRLSRSPCLRVPSYPAARMSRIMSASPRSEQASRRAARLHPANAGIEACTVATHSRCSSARYCGSPGSLAAVCPRSHLNCARLTVAEELQPSSQHCGSRDSAPENAC